MEITMCQTLSHMPASAQPAGKAATQLHQSLSRVRLCDPMGWSTQASLSFTISQSLLTPSGASVSVFTKDFVKSH